MANDFIIKGNQNTTKLLNDLKKSSTQYPCLSKEQEEELIAKYRDDRDQLNKLLFMHNIKAVFNQAKQFVSKVDDFDSLVQDGMIGLGEACKRFDINKGVKFITYALPWIRKYILAHFYRKNVEIDKSSISLDLPTMSHKSSDDGNDVTFENYINDFFDPSCIATKNINHELSSNEQIDLCRKLYERMEHDTTLSSIDKAVFTDAFYNKEKTRDIADKYNLDMADVNEIKHRILGKFKVILQNEFKINSFYDVYCA